MWHTIPENVTTLGRWLIDERDYEVDMLQEYYETVREYPELWTDEWRDYCAECRRCAIRREPIGAEYA